MKQRAAEQTHYLSFATWELLRAPNRSSPNLGGDHFVIVDLGAGLTTVAALVLWFEIVLRLNF